MSVVIKLSTGSTITVDVPDFGVTVAAFKLQIVDQVSIPAAQQRMVYRGKILKDTDVLSLVGVESGHAVHVVKGQKPAGEAATTTPTPTPSSQGSTTTASTVIPPTSNPFAALFNPSEGAPSDHSVPPPMTNPFSMGGGSQGFGDWGLGPQEASQMLQNPMMMQMVAQMMQNPQMMQQAMASNPMLQSLSPAQREQMSQLMQNPQMVQQSLAMMQMMSQQRQQQPGGGDRTSGQNLPNQNAMFNMFPPQQQQQQQGNPRQLFASQLEQLRAMGFPNESANIAALQMSQGNVDFAVDRLLNSH